MPLVKKIVKPDGTTKIKLGPIALLETLVKLVESVAVDQLLTTFLHSCRNSRRDSVSETEQRR